MMRPRMLWLTSTLSTLSRLISKVRRLMNPVLWTTRRLVTSVSVVQRWNQASAVQYSAAIATTADGRQAQQRRCPRRSSRATESAGPAPRSRPRSPADRTSSARWSNTAPFRRAAGFRRYNAPYASPSINPLPQPFCAISGVTNKPVACPRPRRYVYARFRPGRSGFRAGHLTYPRRECTRRHGPPRDEIRRYIRRQYRTHPQRRAPCQARGRCRP